MIQEISTPELQAQYEEFVKSHPKGHFVKSLLWARFKKPFKYTAFFSLDDTGAPRGSMLIFIDKIPKTGFTRLYCPRGPVADDGDLGTLRELTDYAKSIAKEHRACALATDPDIEEDDPFIKDLQSVGFVINNSKHRPEYLQARYVYRLPLSARTSDEVFHSFHSKTRYNTRLAIKKGVACRIGTREDLPKFREIMVETARRDGFLARSLSYFEEMFDLLAPEHLRLYLMEYEGELLAGAVAILYGDKLWYLYGASGNRERNRMPNYLMQWEMIQWAVENGCSLYDFRGVTGDMEKRVLEGLIRFKSGFGGLPANFVGKLDLMFYPRTAKMIESTQSIYRALVRGIGILKSRAKHDGSSD